MNQYFVSGIRYAELLPFLPLTVTVDDVPARVRHTRSVVLTTLRVMTPVPVLPRATMLTPSISPVDFAPVVLGACPTR